MTRRPRYDDAGQAFPIYITVVGGLLFLALAYFAVGQAAANRNGAQTAADAAALAVALDTRDQLATRWAEDVLDPTKWQDIFDGDVAGLAPSCQRGDQLAARNEARVLSCTPEGLLGFAVEVETNKPVGDSIVPGTENKRAKASAKAVIEPRCTFELPAEEPEVQEPEGEGPEGQEPDGEEPEGGPAEDIVLPSLACQGERYELDPEDLGDLPKADELFDVHLAD